MKKGLSLTLEEKVIELVDRKAEELGMSRSVFIEYVLRQYFGLYPRFGGGADVKNIWIDQFFEGKVERGGRKCKPNIH